MQAVQKEHLFSETVVSLYDAATDVDRWPIFLDRLGALFEAPASQVLYYDFERQDLTFQVQRGLDQFPPEMMQRYLELSPEDQYVQAVVRLPGKPHTNAMIGDRQSFESTPLFREVIGPSRMGGYGCGLGVHLEPSAFANVARWSADAPFDDDDVALMGRLVPHLRQAFALHRRLALLDVDRQDALAALDAMPLGIVLTDADGRLRQANRTAREIAARADGLLFTGGSIGAYRQADAAFLFEAVRSAVCGALDGAAPPAQATSIARRDGAADYPTVVSVLWNNAKRFGLTRPDRPLAALFVSDPDRPQEAPAELLQRLFGLTGAEAAVAERLVAGQSLRDAAAELGVSHNTVRTHLKRVFEKTDTARQAELVKKVMETPVWTAALQEAEAWNRIERTKG